MNIERRLQVIDAKRREILDAAMALSPAQLVAQPAGGGWSVLQVIEHLVIAEADVMGDLTVAEQRRDCERHARHVARYAIVMAILRLGIRVSIPAGGMAPTGQQSLGDLREEWEERHIALRALIVRLGSRGMGRMIFRHPVAGPLNMAQTLRLLDAHLDAHRRQLARMHVWPNNRWS